MYYYDYGLAIPKGYIISNPYRAKDTGIETKSTSGLLTTYKYSVKKNDNTRHNALRKANKEYGFENLIKKLTTMYNLNKTINPNIASILKKDTKWVMDTLKYDNHIIKSKKRRSPCKLKSKKRQF